VPAGRRQLRTYVTHVVTHPLNLLSMTAAVLLALLSWNAFVLVVAGMFEVALLMLLPWHGAFRRSVESQITKMEEAAAARAREALVAQMGPLHRDQLARIEGMIERTYDNMLRHAGPLALLPSEMTSLARLLDQYIRLAIAHREGEEALSGTSQEALAQAVRWLEAAESTTTDGVRTVVQQRLNIASMRAQSFRDARHRLDAIAHQLATIVELVQLMLERSAAPNGTDGVSDEIDAVLRGLEEKDHAMRELVTMTPRIEIQGELIDRPRDP
jgi:hypothetical protein